MTQNWPRFATHTRAEPPYSGPMESTKTSWTDERMDEFALRTEENFRDVRGELRSEIGGLRTEMNERFKGLERRFDILFGALATGFVAAVVQHFIG